MVEFEDAGMERMAQLEQEDLEQYQRDVLRNSSYSYDETPNYVDEFQSKLIVLLDMVRGFSSDLKQKTSSIEKGSDPVMNLQPDSIICDEQQPYEVLVVNKVPDSMEMLDLVEIKRDDFSNLKVEPDLEEKKVSESGLMVLSIFCAHMALKWNNVLEMRPTQRNDMSVKIYYAKFITWRNELDALDYIGGEESYIDDFLYGLKRELAVRVWEYNWKPSTLYGAFRIAEIEETIMKNDEHMVFDKCVEQNDFVVLGRMASRIGADHVFVEMPHSTSIGIQGAKYVLDENVNVVLDASSFLNVKLQLDLPAESHYLQSGRWDPYCTDAALENMFGKIVFFKFDPGGSPLSNLKIYKQGTLIEGDKVDGGVVLYVTLQAALGLLDDTTLSCSSNGSTKALLKGAELIIEVVLGQKAMNKHDRNMADEMPLTFQVDAKNEQLMALYTGAVLRDRASMHKRSLRIVSFGGVVLLVNHILSRSGLDDIDSVPVRHGLFIQKKCGLYASDDIMQASATIIGSHKWNINGVLLVVFAASSVLPLSVAWHNTDDVTLITPSVTFAVVIQQLMFSMKAYNIPTAITTTGTTLVIGYGLEWFRKEQLRLLGQMKPKQSTLKSWALLQKFEPRRSLLKFIRRSTWTRRKLPDSPSLSSSSASISLSYSSQLGEQANMSFFFYIIEDNDVLKRKGIGIQLECALKQNDVKLNMVAMQMTQMLQLVEYDGYPYDYVQGAEKGDV